MSKYYRRVEIIDGDTQEPVNMVACHPLRWHQRDEYPVPACAFREMESVDALLTVCKAMLTDLSVGAGRDPDLDLRIQDLNAAVEEVEKGT
jgi:hypothetical protein